MKTRTILSLVAAIAFLLVGMNPAFASERHDKKPDPVIVTNSKDNPVRTKIKGTVKTEVASMPLWQGTPTVASEIITVLSSFAGAGIFS